MNIFKKKKEPDDSWLYILLLSTIVILGGALKNYTFSIKNITLTYTIFILPIIYLLTNYITKKYSYTKGVSAICLSTVAFVLFTYGIGYGLGRPINFLAIGGEVSGYLISQMINLYIYVFLLNNTKSPVLLVWLNYMFSLVIFYMFYTLINLSVLVTSSYWSGYFLTLSIQAIECILITTIDHKVKRGLEK